MSSSRVKKAVEIILDNGEIFVNSPSMSVFYRYRFWLFQINPRFLLPGLRKEHRKSIFVNGKKRGIAEYRQGCIPMFPFIFDNRNFGVKIVNWIRVHLGLLCRKTDRGYFYIRLDKTEYIVLRRFTSARNVLCEIFCKEDGFMMGSFIFDAAFEKVYPYFSVDDWVNSMYVIIGYIADAVVYSTVAHKLNKSLEIVLR